jgi:inorganic triphosphatase YgiF
MPEREAKLVITGERPGAVADAIAGLSTLAGRGLVPTGTVALRDVYLDTPTGALRARRDSLRVRVADGQAFLTLKGGGREVDPGVIERDELETPWSEAAYTRLLDILAERGIPLRLATADGDPVSLLLASGLERLQERETSRRLRHVDGRGSPIAELAVDAVTFHLAAGPVRHHEVEIEAKAPEGAAYLPRAVEALGAQFGPALTVWRYGKLATGLAIARLLASDHAHDWLEDGQIGAAAYPRLAETLSREAAPPGDG